MIRRRKVRVTSKDIEGTRKKIRVTAEDLTGKKQPLVKITRRKKVVPPEEPIVRLKRKKTKAKVTRRAPERKRDGGPIPGLSMISMLGLKRRESRGKRKGN